MTATLQPLVQHLRCWAAGGSLAEPTDSELLERFAVQRDELAFAELVRRHGPMVLGVARRVLHHADDAEDVFQATFLVLARKAASVSWHASAAGWLFPVAYHLALKVRGRRQSRRAHETQVELLSLPERSAPIPDAELLSILDEELSRLPEHYRAVVLLCCLEGKTQKEAAHQLGWSAGQVRGRLDRARERLRQRLVRRGFVLPATAVAAALAQQASAALPTALREVTLGASVLFADSMIPALPATVLPRAVSLAQGALGTMTTTLSKTLSLLILTLGLLSAGLLFLTAGEPGDGLDRALAARSGTAERDKNPAQTPKAQRRRSVIVLWMSGGPSQIDTFDMKPGNANGGPFKEIETTVKGMRFSEHLPRLAKLADHLALVRSLTHQEGDHVRATYVMSTGYRPDGQTEYPSLGAVLARELSDPRADLPRYVAITRGNANGPGFLGAAFAPLVVGATLQLPPLDAFQPIFKDRAAATRNAVVKTFDLTEEKQAVRDAYGKDLFGQSCLLARRLVEKGVPVVDVSLGGWDTHANNFEAVKARCAILDQAWSALLTDLHDRKLLDSTLIVWMGEFGRTPRINQNNGRDHWPRGFTVVLAGGGIKGGVIVGKTSADGVKIEEQPVTPAQLLATIYRASGIDPGKTNRSNRDTLIPLVEKGSEPLKQLLK